ncbi:MAG: geranylgeranylglycerol-phosphate geranylgeranyltransferase [candidate division Zixibacteria bacterium]|nr:geranylgeranylglycerol-phosphate geranylgeranyltransferase [Candidatus Tariuqbacter arcticus]
MKAVFKLSRPVNALITAASVWVAALLAKDFAELNPLTVTLGAVAACLIAAAGNIHNDICDIEIDRINRPGRPLPQKEISLSTAGLFSALFGLAGIVIGLILGPLPLLITASAAFLLFAYNARLKMTALWGNICVSFLTALAFIFGGVLAGNIKGGLIPAVFSLFFHFSREMVKDMEDYTGDSARPGATFARKYGIGAAGRTAVLALVLLLLIVPLPYFAHFYNIYYLIVSLLGVETILLWAIYILIKGDTNKLRILSNILKFGMFIGLIALFLGR